MVQTKNLSFGFDTTFQFFLIELHIYVNIISQMCFISKISHEKKIIIFSYAEIKFKNDFTFVLFSIGFVSSLLKCKVFVIVARLSYPMYLIHFVVQLQSVGQLRQSNFNSYWLLVSYKILFTQSRQYQHYIAITNVHYNYLCFFVKFWTSCADLAATLVYALFINVIVEAPCRQIFNQLLKFILKSNNIIHVV